MYYNVVVKDTIDNYDAYGNSLVFHFGEEFEEAFQFMEKILRTTDYCVEFLQIEKDEEEE